MYLVSQDNNLPTKSLWPSFVAQQFGMMSFICRLTPLKVSVWRAI